MIRLPFEHRDLDLLRDRTTELLAEDLTDDNGLMADLLEIGYLKQPVLGYLGAMAVQYEGRVEFFADSMPGNLGLTANGGAGFNYASIHSQMIRRRDILNSSLPNDSFIRYCTGLITKLDSGLHYSDKSILGLSRQWERQVDDIGSAIEAALAELGLTGEVMSDDLVVERYSSLSDIATPTRILRLAAKWKERTLIPAYDPDKGDVMDTVLTESQALEGLSIEMDDLLARTMQRDIDIIRQVARS